MKSTLYALCAVVSLAGVGRAAILNYVSEPTPGLPDYSTYTFTATSNAGSIVGFNFDQSHGSGLGFFGDFHQVQPYGQATVFGSSLPAGLAEAGFDAALDTHFLLVEADGVVINAREDGGYLGAAFNYYDASRASSSLTIAQLIAKDDAPLTFRGDLTVLTPHGHILQRVGFPEPPPVVEPPSPPMQPPPIVEVPGPQPPPDPDPPAPEPPRNDPPVTESPWTWHRPAWRPQRRLWNDRPAAEPPATPEFEIPGNPIDGEPVWPPGDFDFGGLGWRRPLIWHLVDGGQDGFVIDAGATATYRGQVTVATPTAGILEDVAGVVGIPEPATAVLAGLGLLGVAAARRRLSRRVLTRLEAKKRP